MDVGDGNPMDDEHWVHRVLTVAEECEAAAARGSSSSNNTTSSGGGGSAGSGRHIARGARGSSGSGSYGPSSDDEMPDWQPDSVLDMCDDASPGSSTDGVDSDESGEGPAVEFAALRPVVRHRVQQDAPVRVLAGSSVIAVFVSMAETLPKPEPQQQQQPQVTSSSALAAGRVTHTVSASLAAGSCICSPSTQVRQRLCSTRTLTRPQGSGDVAEAHDVQRLLGRSGPAVGCGSRQAPAAASSAVGFLGSSSYSRAGEALLRARHDFAIEAAVVAAKRANPNLTEVAECNIRAAVKAGCGRRYQGSGMGWHGHGQTQVFADAGGAGPQPHHHLLMMWRDSDGDSGYAMALGSCGKLVHIVQDTPTVSLHDGTAQGRFLSTELLPPDWKSSSYAFSLVNTCRVMHAAAGLDSGGGLMPVSSSGRADSLAVTTSFEIHCKDLPPGVVASFLAAVELLRSDEGLGSVYGRLKQATAACDAVSDCSSAPSTGGPGVEQLEEDKLRVASMTFKRSQQHKTRVQDRLPQGTHLGGASRAELHDIDQSFLELEALSPQQREAVPAAVVSAIKRDYNQRSSLATAAFSKDTTVSGYAAAAPQRPLGAMGMELLLLDLFGRSGNAQQGEDVLGWQQRAASSVEAAAQHAVLKEAQERPGRVNLSQHQQPVRAALSVAMAAAVKAADDLRNRLQHGELLVPALRQVADTASVAALKAHPVCAGGLPGEAKGRPWLELVLLKLSNMERGRRGADQRLANQRALQAQHAAGMRLTTTQQALADGPGFKPSNPKTRQAGQRGGMAGAGRPRSRSQLLWRHEAQNACSSSSSSSSKPKTELPHLYSLIHNPPAEMPQVPREQLWQVLVGEHGLLTRSVAFQTGQETKQLIAAATKALGGDQQQQQQQQQPEQQPGALAAEATKVFVQSGLLNFRKPTSGSHKKNKWFVDGVMGQALQEVHGAAEGAASGTAESRLARFIPCLRQAAGAILALPPADWLQMELPRSNQDSSQRQQQLKLPALGQLRLQLGDSVLLDSDVQLCAAVQLAQLVHMCSAAPQ